MKVHLSTTFDGGSIEESLQCWLFDGGGIDGLLDWRLIDEGD